MDLGLKFNLWGEVYNSGINAGYDCCLHVVALQDNNVRAIDYNISLGTIQGQSYALANASVPYSDSPLTEWVIYTYPTIIPQV